jgi:bacteriocin biosynthesis cyclodehydratase domain-containing protein
LLDHQIKPLKTEQAEAKLRLVEHYAIPMAGGRLQIWSATQRLVLSGRVVTDFLPALFSLLDGSKNRTEILNQLDNNILASQLLELLHEKGLIYEVCPGEREASSNATFSALIRYLNRQGNLEEALRALSQAHALIVNTGPVASPLVSALRDAGISQITLAEKTDVTGPKVGQSCCTSKHQEIPGNDVISEVQENEVKLRHIALPSDENAWKAALEHISICVVLLEGPVLFYPWLEGLNAAAITLNVPWTTVALVEAEEIQIGPTIRPGMTACYKCFEHAFKSNLPNLKSYEVLENYFHAGAQVIDFGRLPSMYDIAANFAAIEVIRTLVPGMIAQTSGRLLVFRIADFSSSYHPVLKLPRCPVCGAARNRPRERVWG